MISSVPLKLDIRHYETVVALVEFDSMTAAAASLAVTQSALSHRLSEAERRLGTKLFSRRSDRRLVPTGNGLAVYQAATRALHELHRLEDAMATASPAVTTTLRVGVCDYEAFHWFPGFLGVVRSKRPDIDLDLVVLSGSPAAELAARSVDLVLSPGTPAGDVDLVHLFDDDLRLICSREHDLSSRESIEAADLIDETVLTYNAAPSPGFEYDRFVRPSGSTPRIVRVVRQTSAIVELVAAGVGVSILSSWATAPSVASGRIATVRCGDGLLVPWHAAVRRNDHVSLEAARLLSDYFASSP